MKIYFNVPPYYPYSTREITLQDLAQEYKKLEHQTYPDEDIVLDYVDNDGNLYFTTRERE
jgi:hypothetical protein